MAGRATLLIVPVMDSSPAAMRQSMLAAAAAGAEAIELRLDFLTHHTEQALHIIFDNPPRPLIATCRSGAEAGRCRLSDKERAHVLAQTVALGARWVDFELAAMDSAAELLAALQKYPDAELIVSFHDFSGRPENLAVILRRLEDSPGHINKIAFAATSAEDSFAALEILRASRKPAMALAMGEAGLASRVLARKFNAFGAFAALSADKQSAPGQPTLADLRGRYRWDSISQSTAVYGVAGCPIGHSMSPAIHNAAYAADDVDAVYLPLLVPPRRAAFDSFIDAILARPWLDIHGLSITVPHKENALARVGRANVDELARSIGAINTVVLTGNSNCPLRGSNTDCAAAMDSLAAAFDESKAPSSAAKDPHIRWQSLANRRVMVIGAGGVARAIVAGLAAVGAKITIYNRTLERAEELASEFSRGGKSPLLARPLSELAAAPLEADAIINCTPSGMYPNVDCSPLAEGVLPRCSAVVFDTIYNPIRTKLIRDAEAAGCRAVTGVDMFINQAAAQYEMWLRRPAPREVMRQALLKKLEA